MSVGTPAFESPGGGTVDDLLTVEVEQRGDHDVVVVVGEVDIATGPKLRDVLTELVSAGRIRLVVDLDQVTFIDSTGLGILLEVHRKTSEHGSLGLVCHGALCVRLFEISGLRRVFTFHDSVSAALTR